ncbi:MAG: hypothetical protein CMP21_02175 [Rickettsiales bacterium]|nr:hypothetical protein [Rickettsiales bacterium]
MLNEAIMTSIQLLFMCSLILGILGVIQFILINKIKLKKNQSHKVSALVSDGIKLYGLRSFSSILQILTYTSLIFYLLSILLNKKFLWDQIGAFFLGGLSMSITLFILTGIIPAFIPKILEKSKGYFKDSLIIYFNTVTMLGFISISIVLIIAIYLLYLSSYKVLIGYGLGIIFSSLFTKIGGGLFKVSSHIGLGISNMRNPELPYEDIRNPGYLTNISADYAHKLSGFCSDIIGSFFLSILSMILFAFAFENHTLLDTLTIQHLKALPLQIISISIISSIIGYLFVHIRIKNHAYQNILLENLYVSLIICSIGTYFIMSSLEPIQTLSIWTGLYTFKPYIAYLAGLVGVTLICYTSEVLTSSNYKTANQCALDTEFGTAMVHFFSISLGLKSNILYLIYLLLICIISYVSAGFYGISIATIAMLSVSSTIITINSFSPLAKSVNKIANLSSSSHTILNHTKNINHLGSSTIAIGNGYSAITSLLVSCAICLATICLAGYSYKSLFSINMLWLLGIILGTMIPLISSGFLVSVIQKTVKYFVKEIKRQFSEIPFLIEGKATPDIIKCTDKAVCYSMDGLKIPGILIALIPILIGYLLNIATLLAFTIGALLTCFGLAYYWSIVGDVINNAKTQFNNGKYGGQTSPFYKEIKQSNHIGTLYKDLLGPSLSLFIKFITILTTIIIIFLI